VQESATGLEVKGWVTSRFLGLGHPGLEGESKSAGLGDADSFCTKSRAKQWVTAEVAENSRRGRRGLHRSSGAQTARAFRMTEITFLLGGRGCGFAEGDGELGLAGFGGVIEGAAGAVAFAGFEKESALGAVGEAGEAGFAVYIGADFEV
jgi:hypothetical protein